MYVRDTAGNHWALSEVKGYRRGDGEISAIVGPGRTVAFNEEDFAEALEVSARSIVAAAPGAYVLEAVGGLEAFKVYRYAIVAWAITACRSEPVTMDGVNHGQPEGSHAIRFPCGRVEDGDEEWVSEEAWAAARRGYLQRAAEQAA